MSCGSTITTKDSKKGYTKPTMTTPKDKKTTWTQI